MVYLCGVAYKGRPLYFYSGDANAGDTNGYSAFGWDQTNGGDVSGWWIVEQEQVALQVQGSSVIRVIKLNNGILHEIDTAITAADKAR